MIESTTYTLCLPSGLNMTMSWEDLNYCAHYFRYINMLEYIHENYPELTAEDLHSITAETIYILEKMEGESDDEEIAIREAFLRKGLDY